VDCAFLLSSCLVFLHPAITTQHFKLTKGYFNGRGILVLLIPFIFEFLLALAFPRLSSSSAQGCLRCGLSSVVRSACLELYVMSVTCMSLVWSMLLCLYWSACLCHLFDVQVFPERWRSATHPFSIRRGVQGLKVSSSSIKILLIFVQILYICPFLPFFSFLIMNYKLHQSNE
jgi:hypothetical protein